jgi:hypothetical protein
MDEPIGEQSMAYLQERARQRLIISSIRHYLKYSQKEIGFKELKPFILDILKDLEAHEEVYR